MGEVWKARDTRVDRMVAIKTSPQQFSGRFEREARAIRKSMRVHWIVSAEIVLAVTGAFVYYYWPQSMALPRPQIRQQISEANGGPVVSWPGRYLVGKLGGFDEPLSAYLMFDYLRSQDPLRGRQVLLATDSASGGLPYRISLHLPDDVLAGVEELAELKANHLTSLSENSWITQPEFSEDLRQTNLFVQSYNSPDFPNLDEIPSVELQSNVRQFICFKSLVDPRTWGQNPSSLSPPSLEDAGELASDIIEVAGFYNLPVDVLLGIGAMENNFLSAPGDLNNAIWKKDVGTDDIVLRRKGRMAWVLNSSMGTWQITRQSLRYSHELFLCDTRDYSKLSVQLRPTERLDMNFLSSHVLTTYAALVLRDLVDYFDGDVFLATAAYNGTKLHPNLQYASGVEAVANYARRVIGNAVRFTRINRNQSDKAQRNQEPMPRFPVRVRQAEFLSERSARSHKGQERLCASGTSLFGKHLLTSELEVYSKLVQLSKPRFAATNAMR